MKIGIIVARFQSPYLHEGHLALVKYVKERNDKVVIFLGTTVTRLTKNNPLDFETRKKMVAERFPDIEIHEFPDQKHNDKWNEELDKLIDDLHQGNDIILYGSRDSFVNNYHGKYRTEIFQEIPNISATQLRNSCNDSVQDNRQFREGIIYASNQKYPTSWQAVDIAIINFDKKEILLGKKSGEDRFRFIGGFVDVKDSRLEISAKREVVEECGDIETDQYEYITSLRIDDWRYRNTEDKIMTAFFCCHFIFGHVQAKDDIAELEWKNLKTLSENDLEPEHHELLKALQEYLWNLEHDKK